MHIDQEQTTQSDETTNSEVETTSETSEQGSHTSTTETSSDETVDLAADVTDEQQTDETTEQTEDTRTDEEREADDAAEAARAELFGAPAEGEDYQIEGLPEGMTIDQEALAAVTPTFRELGLSSKGASKVAGVYAEKVLPHVSQQVVNGIEQDIIAKRKGWEDEAREAVKTNGAELKNAAGETLTFDEKPLEEVRRVSAKALDRIAPQGFREWLKETGLSVHPMMVAFTYQAGKMLAEDTDLETTETNRQRDTGSSERRKQRAGGLDPALMYNREGKK